VGVFVNDDSVIEDIYYKNNEKEKPIKIKIDYKKYLSIIWRHKFKIIFISLILPILTINKEVSKPYIYESVTMLLPQNQPTLKFTGDLGMSVINLPSTGDSGGSKLDPVVSMGVILDDIDFTKYMIKKYNLPKLLVPNKKNFIYPKGHNLVEKIKQKIKAKIKEKLHRSNKKQVKEVKAPNEASLVLGIRKKVKSIIKISKDSKTGLIALKADLPDRFLAKKLVDIYLTELTARMRYIEMHDVDKQIKYYQKQLDKTMDVLLKKQFVNLLTGLIQKRALSLANPYYNVFQMQKPRVPYVQEHVHSRMKVKIIVSFIASMVFGIFIAFLLEMRKEKKSKNKEKKSKNHFSFI
jgi:uncharacterized protein involved in exopolysaccharide biosynthesis